MCIVYTLTNSINVYPCRKGPFFHRLKSKIGTPNLTIACDNKLFVCDVAFSYGNMKSIIDLIDFTLHSMVENLHM